MPPQQTDQPNEQDTYKIGGMNVDVNPFQQKDEDCNLILNWYSKRYLAKKVRFGYTKFLDNPDNSPVRNLIFYQFPGTTGILRISGKKTYVSTTQSGSWGSSIPTLDWTVDEVQGTANLSGTANFVHLSNSTDGYKTWNGTTGHNWTGSFTPKASFLAAFQSRIFADINQLAIAESWVGFDQNLPMAASGDPFYFDPLSADPSQGGQEFIDSGNNGSIVGLSVVNGCLMIYKQNGIYRYDGTNQIQLNFAGSVIPGTICTSDYYKTNYFLSYNSLWQTDAQQVVPISFGVNTIIQDTFTYLGVPNPISYSFDYMAFFYFGQLMVKGEVIQNAMLVKDERFNEWYVWSIGHQITAFGTYTDLNNVRHMVTGDNNGNTYVWGEQYTNDAGTPITYRIRTKYMDHGKPSGTKIPQPQVAVSADPCSEAKIGVAKNFTDDFTPIGVASGQFAKFSTKGANYPQYKNTSVEISGSTLSQQPEFYGWSIPFDEEERFSDFSTERSSRK